MKNMLTSAFFTVAAAVGLNMASADTAQAAEIGECFSQAGLNNVMQSEGQRSLVVGNGVIALRDGPGHVGIIYTANDNGDGYIVRTNAPLGQAFSEACITGKMSNVTIFDTRQPGPHPVTLIDGNRETALRECERLGTGGCDFHNDVLERGERSGERVILQAIRTDNVMLTVTMKEADRTGHAGLTTLTGAYIMSGWLHDVSYTQNGLAAIE